jgi:hypothetical protein
MRFEARFPSMRTNCLLLVCAASAPSPPSRLSSRKKVGDFGVSLRLAGRRSTEPAFSMGNPSPLARTVTRLSKADCCSSRGRVSSHYCRGPKGQPRHRSIPCDNTGSEIRKWHEGFRRIFNLHTRVAQAAAFQKLSAHDSLRLPTPSLQCT